MNTLNCCFLISSSMMILVLLDRTTTVSGGCVFNCLTSVIKCKRDVKTPGLLPPGTDCCAIYSDCYLGCKPNADVPTCKKSKRGSWNKRVAPSLSNLLGRMNPRSEFQLPSNPHQSGYYRDAISYLLEPTGDEFE